MFALPETMTFSEWQNVFGENANRHSKMKTLGNRKIAFNDNVEKIKAHNSKNLSWRMGVNLFSDLTADEFSELMGFAIGRKYMNETQRLHEKRPKRKLSQVRNPKNAATVDWRNTNNPLGKAAVTPVKNQQECASSWSFSASGAVEGALVLNGNSLVPLSEQELISCDKQNSACSGGSMDFAFEYVRENGLTSESTYPYVSSFGQVPACDYFKVTQRVANISSFVKVQTRSEDALENALNNGPVAIAIEADSDMFQFYSSGVLIGECGDSLNQGVLAVGYGHDSHNNLDYWIVKNSWGPQWGLSGYVYMARHVSAPGGQCGILLLPSYPVAGNAIPTPKPSPSPSPSPKSKNYEDPGEYGEKGCNTGEIPIWEYFEIPGRMCMPTCKSSYDCPDTPAGWNASSCILKIGENMLCAVKCSGLAPCAGGTVCKTIIGIADICLYV